MAINSTNIKIPIRVFETAESKEDIEDWLFSRDKEFLKKMRKARKEDLKGNIISLKQLQKDMCIK